MRRILSRGNKTTEMRLAKLFRQHGICGWRRHLKLRGSPDFAFPKARLAVFVDGCFWHGHACRNLSPNKNRKLWEEKIRRNVERDGEVTRALEKWQWQVIRIWECELGKDQESVIARIRQVLEEQLSRA